MRIVIAAVVVTVLSASLVSAQLKMTQQQPARGQPQAAVQNTPAQISQGNNSPNDVRRITADEATKLVNEGKAVFVDIRSATSYYPGHIKGAVNIPLINLSLRMRELPRDKMLITYCACKDESQSIRAVLEMNSMGFTNAAALIGGWDDWKAANRPTESR